MACGALVLASPLRAWAQSPPEANTTIAVGDWQLAPTLQLRTRGEYRHDPVELGGVDSYGQGSARVRDAFGVFERARIGLGAEHGALRAQLTLQDARAWGSPVPNAILGTGTGASFAQLGAYEAFVEARTSAARPSFVRLGRQAITWGEGRLVGNADWSPTARTLDALRGHLSAGNWDFELLAAILDAPQPLGVSASSTSGPSAFGAQLYGAQAGLAIDPLFKIELSALARITQTGAQNSPDATSLGFSPFARARAKGETYVGSLRIFGEARGWRYAIEGAYELGRTALLADANVSAYAGAAYVEKKLDTVLLSPSLRIGVDYASGDDGQGGTYRQFDPLLPDVHAFHGAMDVLAWSNAAEAHARVAIVPFTDTRASIEYRYARMAESHGEWETAYLTSIGRGTGGGGTGGSSELGHEIDALFQYRPWPALDLAAGYSLFVLGDGARAILANEARGALQSDGTIAAPSLSHFGYVQATLNVP